jgi:hypothetical protein
MALQGGRKPANPRLYIWIHRIAGWTFVVLFTVIFIFMLARIKDYWEESSPRIALHVVLSCALVVMIAAKALIPRVFPKLRGNLFALGFATYVVSFAMVAVAAGYYIVWRYKEPRAISHAELQTHMLEESLGKEMFIGKCSICHDLKDIMTPRSPQAWEKVVNDMITLAEPRITRAEGEQILGYLAKTHVPQSFRGPESATLLQQHCLPCHDATEIFSGRQLGRDAWAEIVRQMTAYDPEIVPPDKIDEIADYLLKTQQDR